MFIHLIVGSLYQWGIINIYVTSFYKLSQSDLTLENNGVIFPVMMICMGLTMRPGIMLAEKIGTLWVLVGFTLLSSGLVLITSFMPNFVSNAYFM